MDLSAEQMLLPAPTDGNDNARRGTQTHKTATPDRPLRRWHMLNRGWRIVMCCALSLLLLLLTIPASKSTSWPALEPYDAKECHWSSPPPSNSSSMQIAVCLAGAFRTIGKPAVADNIRRYIDSLGHNVHVFAVGQQEPERGTGNHLFGQKSRVDEASLHQAWMRLQPICVRVDERPPPCETSSCTGQWNKWSECARLVQAFSAARGITYDRVIKLRFDVMLPPDYPSLRDIGALHPKNKNTTFMDDDHVIIWPGAMLDAVAAMPYKARCWADSRCPLLDYGKKRPTCGCLAKTYFEDTTSKDGLHVVSFYSGARGPPFTIRYHMRRDNETAVLNFCARMSIMERAAYHECAGGGR